MGIKYRNYRYDKPEKLIVPRNKGVISNSITQNWTEQAVYCYKISHDCKQCTIGTNNYSFVCQMKKVVKILLKEIGNPDQEKIDKLLSYLD